MEGYINPNSKRIFEVKKKRAGKQSSRNFEKLIKINKYLPDGNEDQSEQESLENWIANSIGFLNPSSDWGNQLQGEDWVGGQRKIQELQLVEQSKISKTLHKENKITLIQTSIKSPLLNPNPNQTTFVDSEFPPSLVSLTGQWGFMEKYKQVNWLKATQAIPNCKIFTSKITPKDIIQGKLGDCYFLAALAALAERPDRIYGLFLTQQISNKRYFSVRLLFKGRWKLIDMDEYFPFAQNSPIFSHAVRNQLWVMLLEKAWAKLYTNYMRISAGHAEQPLHDFTGAPIRFFKLKENNLDKQALWKYLMKASKRQYAMCASSNQGSDEKMSETGIVQGHAYTILNAIVLTYEGKKIRLLQLRNPWGKKESVGNWCDKDPRWKKVSKEEKDRIKFQPTLTDGIFYIELQDFLLEYRSITVAQINDNASYINQTAKDPNIEGVYFKVELKETGLYSFQVDKTPKRFFNSKQQIGYRYPQAIVKIFSSFQDYRQVHHFQDFERLTSRRYSMYKGVYIVFVFIHFNKDYERDYDVNLAIYSQFPASIQIAGKKDITKMQPIVLRLKSPDRKSKSKSKAKTPVKQLKVSTIRFNYISPIQSIPKTPNNEERNIVIDNNVNLQVKEKRENKKSIINVGGKSIVVDEKDPKKQWGNHVDGQEWVEKQAENHSASLIPGTAATLVEVLQKQVTFLEPCPQTETIKQTRKVNKDFIDERFPPNLTTLTGQWGDIPEWKNVRWQRISKIMPNSKIFQGKISPQSIKQGFLGDCYFLAGIAALAQRPDRIFNLFLQHERNQSNFYSVKMLYKGKWLTINMDDYIPYMYDLPAFSRANKDELWVMLLEKAWAKIYSSFKRIQAGFPQETLHDLTGAPIKHIYLQRSSFNMEKQWKYLMDASAIEYSMVASSQPGSDALKSVAGIVGGHAYTLLSVAEISFNNKIERLVQLRNPWGKGENVGKWSDIDPNWSLIDEQTKARLGYAKADDGIFFMPYQIFCKQFKIITVAEINDNASYVYKSVKDPEKNGCFFKVEILQKGRYSFQVDTTPERTFEFKYNTTYRSPNVRFQLGIMTDKGYIRRLTAMESNTRTLFYVEQFEAGIYICFVRIDFDTKFEKDFDVNLAMYGDYVCHVDLASKEEAISFTNNPNVKWKASQPQAKKKEVEWNTLRSYRPSNSKPHR